LGRLKLIGSDAADELQECLRAAQARCLKALFLLNDGFDDGLEEATVTTMTMTKYDQQLRELTDALRLCLTAVVSPLERVERRGFTAGSITCKSTSPASSPTWGSTSSCSS